ncbi:MAG: chemotaxis protein [Lachnospiraceae bacterium]|nr:chemotaxis protein [Lachnospiraceae bacterium]
MEKKITEKARCNYYAMMCHTVVTAVLILAYAIEVFAKHDRSIVYFIIMILLGGLPVLIEHLFYKKDNETEKLKLCIASGFIIFYGYLLFTANNSLTFTYAVLIMLVMCVFNNQKYSLIFNSVIIVLNIVQVIIGANTNSLGYTNLAGAEIQVLLLVLLSAFGVTLTRTLSKNSDDKMAIIVAQQEKTDALYTTTIETVNKMTEDINDMYVKVNEISETVQYTRNAMEEVSQGSADTSSAVQNQLIQTQNIQENLSEVDNAAETLLNEMTTSRNEIETGKVNMGNMVEKVNESVESGKEVAGQLETLDEMINEMNSIVGIITGITSQTSLLALNASIEAARAGEAGRGFAVVASEISNMATQTKEATIHITELIENVSGAIRNVVSVIREMIEAINLEKEITVSTEQSFVQISDSSDVMNEKIVRLTEIVTELVKANTDIIDSIQTISGVSEEVSAHATETFDAEENNVTKLGEITELMEDLKELTAKLN